MKQTLTRIGVIALILSGTVVLAQNGDNDAKPVPESGDAQTNKNGIRPRNTDRGIFIDGTNVTGRTNGIGRGAPGANNAIERGRNETQPERGLGKAPSVGEAPSVGKTPSIGGAPSVGNPPSVGTAPSPGDAPKVR